MVVPMINATGAGSVAHAGDDDPVSDVHAGEYPPA
jgi:hypothetical protein